MSSGGGPSFKRSPPPPSDRLVLPFGPQPTTEGENRMAGFTHKLELEDGTAADPPILDTAVPNWRAGDTIPLGQDKILRVIDVRPGPDESRVLVVETT